MKITCQTCNIDLPVTQDIELALMQHHMFGPHSGNHPLIISGYDDGDVEVQLTCLTPNCQFCGKTETFHVKRWLVGAIVVQFHSKNEGHHFSLVIDGQEIKPKVD